MNKLHWIYLGWFCVGFATCRLMQKIFDRYEVKKSKNKLYGKTKNFKEGVVCNGGIKEKPTAPRPLYPPKGQGREE